MPSSLPLPLPLPLPRSRVEQQAQLMLLDGLRIGDFGVRRRFYPRCGNLDSVGVVSLPGSRLQTLRGPAGSQPGGICNCDSSALRTAADDLMKFLQTL
jgi:hypothetical protein